MNGYLFVGPSSSGDPLEYFNREVQKRREEEANLWSTPGDPSHSEREDDRYLYSLLQARNKTRMGSSVCLKTDQGLETWREMMPTEMSVKHCCSFVQGYRRLSVDIEAMRDTRREVRDKWQTILENLGNAGRLHDTVVSTPLKTD